MGGSQARPIISKNVQTYKSAVGVEHKPEKTMFDKIMESGESYKDVPYAYSDTQEEKLRKVREELLRRIDSHTHAEVTQLISTVATQMTALSSKVELLEITVKTQAALIEQLKSGLVWFTNNNRQDSVKNAPEEIWISPATVRYRLSNIGIAISFTDLTNLLVTRKYLLKLTNRSNVKTKLAICKDNGDWEKVIKERQGSSNFSGGLQDYMISESYYINTLVPYFKKRQEAMENFNKQFESGEGGV